MNSNNPDREILKITWPSEDGNPFVMAVGTEECDRLVLRKEFHGDRDDDWILQLKNGVELARYNPRYIEAIMWKLEIGSQEGNKDDA